MLAVRGLLLGLLLCCLVGGLLPAVGTAGAEPKAAAVRVATAEQERVRVRVRAAVRRLDVRRERRAGYDREAFEHWIDGDGDCLDTRDEVLKSESRRRVAGPACDVARGEWFSYYDRATWRRDDDVDIDHLVPLAEAWDSGARRWDHDTRRRFANDLRDGRTLIAVTDNVNQSKGDQDVAEWLPQFGRCRYVRQWAVVKLRWSLRVNRAEKQVLRTRSAHCPNPFVTFRKAAISPNPTVPDR